jgi:hypothetical protein
MTFFTEPTAATGARTLTASIVVQAARALLVVLLLAVPTALSAQDHVTRTLTTDALLARLQAYHTVDLPTLAEVRAMGLEASSVLWDVYLDVDRIQAERARALALLAAVPGSRQPLLDIASDASVSALLRAAAVDGLSHSGCAREQECLLSVLALVNYDMEPILQHAVERLLGLPSSRRPAEGSGEAAAPAGEAPAGTLTP